MIVFTTVLMAVAAGLFAWTIGDVLWSERVSPPGGGRFERERREVLRQANPTYRRFEPLIDEWAAWWKPNAAVISQTQDLLRGAGVGGAWTPRDFLMVKRVEGVLIACFLGLLMSVMFGFSTFGAILLAVVAFFGHQSLTLRTLKSRATVRQLKMKRRFAGAIDLMALMMEVGAGFQECLETAVQETRGHPLGDELAVVQKEISMGSLRSAALQGLADRTRDPDMVEVIMSINEGEELGTPLTAILRNQADLMRQKRSQWAEKAAEESQVAIVFPAMLIMVACLLIIVGPFVLTVLFGESP